MISILGVLIINAGMLILFTNYSTLKKALLISLINILFIIIAYLDNYYRFVKTPYSTYFRSKKHLNKNEYKGELSNDDMIHFNIFTIDIKKYDLEIAS